jgi:hypothetical protein
MPHPVNKEKSDLSVSVGTRLRKAVVAACGEDEITLSQATKVALERWLAARNKKRYRAKSEDCEP